MIRSVRADKESFKPIYFTPGLNIIVAERTKDSTKKDSRNGLGKSALIEIIHYCMGSNRGETLKKPELDNWNFTLDIILDHKEYSLTRNTSLGNRVTIDGDCSNWSIEPSIDLETSIQTIHPNNLRIVLGQLMFGLTTAPNEDNYNPTFGSLISYFIRRNSRRGGFLNPFQQFKNQHEWDIQVNNTYLLGLSWEVASKWQTLKDRNKVLSQIKKEMTAGTLSNITGSIGELETKRIRLNSQLSDQETRLQDFKVLPEYDEINKNANALTRKIHDLVNDNVKDSQLLEYYESSLEEEIDASAELVMKVYNEAGLVLGHDIEKELDDLYAFHKQVVANRKSFLSSEMRRLQKEISGRDDAKSKFVDERAYLMNLLKTHGALEEYTELQRYHQNLVSELNDIKSQIANITKLENGKSSIVIEQELLQQEAQSDLKERESQKEQSILLFNQNSEYLYEAPGALSIDLKKTGYKFSVKIERAGSHGIGNMEIFCYDLMLAQLWATKNKSPRLLIHDSVLFADVDERQIAKAIQLVANESTKCNFQYICTLNSDTIPYQDFDESFHIGDYIRQRLTDADEDGCLFGRRF